MAHYRIFNDEKLNNLLDKLYDLQPGALSPQNEKGITVSEKLILIGNLAEMLNKQFVTITNKINHLLKTGTNVRTYIAPTTLNNLLSDVYTLLTDNNYNHANKLVDKYDYVDVTQEITSINPASKFTYKPILTLPKSDSYRIVGKNDELTTLIQKVDFDLIIKIYIIVLGLDANA